MDAATKVEEFVNRRTQTGSTEAAVQSLVRRAVQVGAVYVRKEMYDKFLTEDERLEHYTRALALVEAAVTVTRSELTADVLIEAARDLAMKET